MSDNNNASEQALSAIKADLEAARSEITALNRSLSVIRSERDAAIKSRDAQVEKHDAALKALNDKLEEATKTAATARAEAEGKFATFKADSERALASAEFKAAAIRAGAKNADDLAKLTDLSGVKLKEDGTFEGIEDAVRTAKEARQYLFEEPAKSGAEQGTTQTRTQSPKPDNGEFDARNAADNDYLARKQQFLAAK